MVLLRNQAPIIIKLNCYSQQIQAPSKSYTVDTFSLIVRIDLSSEIIRMCKRFCLKTYILKISIKVVYIDPVPEGALLIIQSTLKGLRCKGITADIL